MKTNIQRLYQTISSQLIIILVFLPLFFLFSFKQGECNDVLKLPIIRKELKVENTFQSIRIEGDISVMLTNEAAGTVSIEGKEKELNKIGSTVENNILIIDGNRKHFFAKVTIYLSAITLQTIALNGDGNISSNDFIKSDHLHISLNGNINVKVKTMGQLSFDTPDDIELSKKSTINKEKK